MKANKIAAAVIIAGMMLTGCGGKSDEDIIQLSKAKYTADAFGNVVVKGKLDSDEDNQSLTAYSECTIDHQSCEIDDDDNFTMNIQFATIYDLTTAFADVTISTTEGSPVHQRKLKVNLEKYTDTLLERRKAEEKQQEQYDSEKEILKSYVGKTTTEIKAKIDEMQYTASYIYEKTGKDYTEYVNDGNETWNNSWIVTSVWVKPKYKKITVYVKGL